MFVVAKLLDGSRCHLVRRDASAQGTLCYMRTHLPPPLIRGTELHFLSDVYCDQMAGWIQMPLGTKVGLGPGHIVSDGDPVPQRGHSPQFSAHVYCGQTVAYLSC